MTDLNDAVIFARVVREQSFTKAARAIGMPKSTISERVSRLESRLGVRLFERITRGLRLTAAGEVYHERVLRVVQELEEADAAVTAFQQSPQGLLRVVAPLLFARDHLIDLVTEYSARYPEVSIDLVVADRSFNIIEEGFDVGFHTFGPIDDQLVARKLLSLPLICVASPKYIETHGAPRHVSELSEHACILGFREMPFVFTRNEEVAAVNIVARHTVSSLELVYRAVLEGNGIGIFPSFLCDKATSEGELVQLLADWSLNHTSMHVVYQRQHHTPVRVRAFIDLLLDRGSLTPPIQNGVYVL